MKDIFLKQWNKSISRLSNPIIAIKTSFFSQETAQLIFILIFFIIISDTSKMIEFSQSITGRIAALFISFYATLVHPMLGSILSMILILYYHTDLFKAYYYDSIFYRNAPSTIMENFEDEEETELEQENFEDEEETELEQENFEDEEETELEQENFEDEEETETKEEYIEPLQNMEASTINSAYPFTREIQTIPSKFSPTFRSSFFKEFNTSPQQEGFTPIDKNENLENFVQKEYNFSQYKSTYDQRINSRQSDIVHSSKYAAEEEAHKNALFRQENCNTDGQLIYKGSVVKPFVAEFIFPELQIEGSQNGHPCNSCNSNCNIHISKKDQRLNTESILQKRNRPSLQKTSSDWIPTWFDTFLPHPVFQTYESDNPQSFAKPSNLSD